MKTRRINGKAKDDPGGDRSVPRDLMDKSSPQWCRRTLERLKWNMERMRCSRDEYEKTLDELKETKAWVTLKYPDLDIMLKQEIGMNVDEGRKIIALGPRGRPKKGKEKGNGAIFPRGNTQAYKLARLARDHPDIKARYDAGEIPTVTAAAIEAGFEKRKFNCPIDPVKAAKRILKHFKGKDLEELLCALKAK